MGERTVRAATSRRTVVLVSLLGIGGIAGGSAVLGAIDTELQSTDHAQRWVVAEPAAEDATEDAPIHPHDDERIADLPGLQETLQRAESANERIMTELSTSANEDFVESTRSIDRIADEPGFYVRYNGKVFQVYNQGLT